MRKELLLLLILSLLCFRLQSQNLDDLNFGSDTTFEVMTWNIEWFPKNGQTTMYYVSQIIDALQVDLIGVQEIDDKAKFGQMIAGLDGWNAYYLYGEYQSLAYIYRPSVVEILDVYEVFTEDWREFPRSPLVIEVLYQDVKYIIINNHLKCCGDGDMDLFNMWDEETRRYNACNMLEGFIQDEYPNDRVILLGDLNDILTDDPDNNVFKAFFDQPDKYLFADMQIAGGSESEWSYPSWPSHLDHLLLSDELLYDFWDEGTEVRTIKLDDYFQGGMDEYDEMVSDHRPVALKFSVPENFGYADNQRLENFITVSPNPACNFIHIKHHESIHIESLEMYGSTGEMIFKDFSGMNQMDVSSLTAGIYLLLIYTQEGIISRKIVIKR